jgi:uncharacterized protein
MDPKRYREENFAAYIALILCAVLLACLTAPPLFNLLLRVARTVPLLDSLRDATFEQVISRITLIYLILGGVVLHRWLRPVRWRTIGLPPLPSRWRIMRSGWFLAAATILPLLLLAWASGSYVWHPGSMARVVSRIVAYFAAGLLISCIEEVLFRGALFGSLRRRLHWLPAAILISLFFSLVHFFRPEFPAGIAHAHWDSGFRLLPHIFYRTTETAHYIPFSINLFLMSLGLCVLCYRMGHIYFIIGLHAGWVFCLQLGRVLFRNVHPDHPLFGVSANISRSWSATLMLVLFLVYAALRKVPVPGQDQ